MKDYELKVVTENDLLMMYRKLIEEKREHSTVSF